MTGAWAAAAPIWAGGGRRWAGGRRLVAVLVAIEAAATVLLVLAPAEISFSLALVLGATAAAAAAHGALPAAERDRVFILFGAGLLIRLTVMLALRAVAASPANPHGFLASDSFGYDRVGWDFAQHWRQGLPPRIAYQTAGLTIGFHVFVGAIYAVIGRAPLFVQTLNALLSAALVPLTFVLGRELAGRRAGFVAAALIAVWPPVVFWTVQLLKDAAIAFLLLVSVLGWIATVRRPRLRHLALALGPALPLVFARAYLFVFWAMGMAAGLAAAALRRRALVAVLVAVLVGWIGIGAALEHTALRLRDPAVWLMRLSAGIGTDLSLFGGVRYASWGDLLAFYPLGLGHFLLTPLPWRTELPAEAIGAALRYALLPFAAFGLADLLRRERLAVLAPAVCAFLTLSLFAIAFRGGSPRHWVQFTPYLAVCAAAGMPRFPHWPLPMALGGAALLAAAWAVGAR